MAEITLCFIMWLFVIDYVAQALGVMCVEFVWFSPCAEGQFLLLVLWFSSIHKKLLNSNSI